MIREILRMGDARLLAKSRAVEAFDTAELRALVGDMEDTMRAASGAGLAAPQIGVGLRVVIFGFDANPRYPHAGAVPYTVLINPLVAPVGDETEEDWEGCLSVPGLRGRVPRATRVRYTGLDVTGNPIERIASGFHARVVQHECDHLDGVLYTMRIRDFSQFGFTDVLFHDADLPDE